MTYSAEGDARLDLTCWAEHGYVVAALKGELGIASAPALRERLINLLRPAATQLIMDLSAVEHADASGLAVLVGSGRRARLLGGSLRLAAPSAGVAKVLSATGIGQHLDIFPTVRAAITGQRPHESTANQGPASPQPWHTPRRQSHTPGRLTGAPSTPRVSSRAVTSGQSPHPSPADLGRDVGPRRQRTPAPHALAPPYPGPMST